MSNILQDMLGMLSRKKVVIPKINDYITVARTSSGNNTLKPQPGYITELISVSSLGSFINANDYIETTYAKLLNQWIKTGF